jgi:16S rRNA processing protein RimM
LNQTEVGKLNKAFGIKGLIRVVPTKAFIPDLKKSQVWYVQKGNNNIPYFVERIENDPHFLVKFEDIDTPEAAKSITGCTLWLRNKDITIQNNEVENDMDKLTGFQVFDEEIEIGKIIKIEEYPQQLMAFIQKNEVQFMMPLTPEFIVDIDPSTKNMIVKLPEGFVESQL